jgi:hypothetical protein
MSPSSSPSEKPEGHVSFLVSFGRATWGWARSDPGRTDPPIGAEPGEQYLPWAPERMPQDEDVVPGAAGYRAGGHVYGRAVGPSISHDAGISGTAVRRRVELRLSAGRRRSGSESGESGRPRHGRSIETTRHAVARGRRCRGRIAEAPADHAAREDGPTQRECVVTGLDHREANRSATGWGATTHSFASAPIRSASAASRAAWPCAESRIASASGCCAGSGRATRGPGASTGDGSGSGDSGAKHGGSVG